MFRFIDHMVVAVRDLDEGVAAYEKLGLELESRGAMADRGIRNASCELDEWGTIEVVEPLSPETDAARALGGGGLVVALGLESMKDAIADLKARGVRLIGADGENPYLVFIHPRESKGVLLQLVERPRE